MRIMVILPSDSPSSAYQRLLLQNLQQAENLPVVQYSSEKTLLPNPCIVLLQQEERKAMRSWYWGNVKLPSIIKKTKTDKIVWVDDVVVNNFSIPQYGIFSNFKLLSSLNKKEQQFIAQLQYVYTGNEADVTNMLQQFPSLSGKIKSLNLWQETNRIVTNEEIEQLKETNTAGTAFFYTSLTNDDESSFLQILKAFSIFKKWQLSGMKLVVNTTLSAQSAEKLSNYKFRNDVVITNDGRLAAAAYAIIHSSTEDNSYGVLLPYLQMLVPVIVHELNVFKAIFSNNIYYADVTSEKSLGTAMVELYRNEVYRSKLIRQAKQFAENIQPMQQFNDMMNKLMG
jgi:hypothetical protein